MFDTIPFVRPDEDDANKAFFTFIGNSSFLQVHVDEADFADQQLDTFLVFLETQGVGKEIILKTLLEQLIGSSYVRLDLNSVPAYTYKAKLDYILNVTNYYIENIDGRKG